MCEKNIGMVWYDEPIGMVWYDGLLFLFVSPEGSIRHLPCPGAKKGRKANHKPLLKRRI